ncbi:hypothetical protein [Paraburkholderia sacchari]|uniref:hypothetical protein n=1 Tax=Paraburkholderia sacchari TaxID=159450 RepID=UPI001BD08FA8|nr:hypothetical protein [Paraburkholderia sacchari]
MAFVVFVLAGISRSKCSSERGITVRQRLLSVRGGDAAQKCLRYEGALKVNQSESCVIKAGRKAWVNRSAPNPLSRPSAFDVNKSKAIEASIHAIEVLLKATRKFRACIPGQPALHRFSIDRSINLKPCHTAFSAPRCRICARPRRNCYVEPFFAKRLLTVGCALSLAFFP